MIVAGLCAKAPAVFRRTPVTEGCFHSHAGSNVVSCAHELESDSSVEEGVVHPGFVFKSFGDARFLEHVTEGILLYLLFSFHRVSRRLREGGSGKQRSYI